MPASELTVRFLCFIILLICTAGHLPAQRLEAGFDHPPNEARPRAYWVLVNGNFSLSQMTEELREFKEKGLGGVDLWDVAGWVDENEVVPAGPRFMGEASLQAIAHGIREGKRMDLLMGLTISSSWNAGGDWVAPEDGVMGLFRSQTSLTGGRRITLELPFPDYETQNNRGDSLLIALDEDGLPLHRQEVAVLAYPVSPRDADFVDQRRLVDLTDKVVDGRLSWRAPRGTWIIERYVGMGTGQPLMRPSPNANGRMIDHFSAAAMERNLAFFFEKLSAKLGPLGNSGLQYLYTDSYEANSASWTKEMPVIFEQRNGYSLTPYLPALAGKVVGDKMLTERFLFDFRQTLSDLIVENHYALGKKLANEKGLGFIAEAGGPGPPVHNTPFESLRALGVLDVPRGEFWFEPNWPEPKKEQLQIVKGPASAAHLYNQPRVEAEAFTGLQIWQFGPGDLKASADRAMAEGLTSFIYHTSPHIPPEAGSPGWVYNFGTLINTTRTWWPQSAAFHAYLGRSCFLLQQGHFVGDALFYYGDDAPNFIDHAANSADLGFGYDYDGLNTDVLLNHLRVENGYFVLPHGPRYKVLVLPDEEAINPMVLAKVKEFLVAGGTVIGNPPVRTYGLADWETQDKYVQKTAPEIWQAHSAAKGGKLYAKSTPVASVLRQEGVVPDVTVSLEAPAQKLRFIHRTGEDFDLYFLQNKTDQPLNFEAIFRSDKGSPELWDPYLGQRTPQSFFVQSSGRTTMPLHLAAEGSVFVVFQRGKEHPAITAVETPTAKLFPNGEQPFPISQAGEDFIFSSGGQYTFTFAAGKQVDMIVGDGPTARGLTGAWELRFPHGWGAPASLGVSELKSLTDFTDPFIQHFSGIVAYHHQFELREGDFGPEQQLTLDLGAVSKVAEVFLNGHRLPTLWHAPFTVDITQYAQEGDNYLVVEVANVMNNRLIGDAKGIYGDLKRTHSNITRAPNAWSTPYQEAELVPAGLLGPVRLITRPKYRRP